MCILWYLNLHILETLEVVVGSIETVSNGDGQEFYIDNF